MVHLLVLSRMSDFILFAFFLFAFSHCAQLSPQTKANLRDIPHGSGRKIWIQSHVIERRLNDTLNKETYFFFWFGHNVYVAGRRARDMWDVHTLITESGKVTTFSHKVFVPKTHAQIHTYVLYIYVHTHTHIHSHKHMYTCIHARMRARAHTHTHTHTVCIPTQIHNICTYMHATTVIEILFIHAHQNNSQIQIGRAHV